MSQHHANGRNAVMCTSATEYTHTHTHTKTHQHGPTDAAGQRRRERRRGVPPPRRARGRRPQQGTHGRPQGKGGDDACVRVYAPRKGALSGRGARAETRRGGQRSEARSEHENLSVFSLLSAHSRVLFLLLPPLLSLRRHARTHNRPSLFESGEKPTASRTHCSTPPARPARVRGVPGRAGRRFFFFRSHQFRFPPSSLFSFVPLPKPVQYAKPAGPRHQCGRQAGIRQKGADGQHRGGQGRPPEGEGGQERVRFCWGGRAPRPIGARPLSVTRASHTTHTSCQTHSHTSGGR